MKEWAKDVLSGRKEDHTWNKRWIKSTVKKVRYEPREFMRKLFLSHPFISYKISDDWRVSSEFEYFHVTTNAPIGRNLYLLQTVLKIHLIYPVSFSPSQYSVNLGWVRSYNFFICHYDFNICIGKNILYMIPGVCIHLLAQCGCESPLNLLIVTFVITTYSMAHLSYRLLFYSLFKTYLISFSDSYIHSSLDLLKYF